MIALVTLEECGEMLGVALALRALLYHLRDDCLLWRVEPVGASAGTQ